MKKNLKTLYVSSRSITASWAIWAGKRYCLIWFVLFVVYFKHPICTIVWPHWWSFADVSQQGLDCSKKISKRKIFFDLAFKDVHMGCQKVPKSDFQSQFSMSKFIQIFLIFFSMKNISLEEGFFVIVIFWKLQLLKHFVF